MKGVGDCTTVPYDQVPKGKVLWHDLSIIRNGSEENEDEVQSAMKNV